MVCQGDESVYVMVTMVIKASGTSIKCPPAKISSLTPLTIDLSGVSDTHAQTHKQASCISDLSLETSEQKLPPQGLLQYQITHRTA